MIVEHITAISNNSTLRDTKSILPSTEFFFRAFGIKTGTFVKQIKDTPLTCRITAVPGAAAFDLIEGETTLFVNFCCFKKEMKEDCLTSIKELCSKIPLGSMISVIEPKQDLFIYTIPIHPFSTPNVLEICGEIELYIFYELYKAQKNGN